MSIQCLTKRQDLVPSKSVLQQPPYLSMPADVLWRRPFTIYHGPSLNSCHANLIPLPASCCPRSLNTNYIASTNCEMQTFEIGFQVFPFFLSLNRLGQHLCLFLLETNNVVFLL